MATYSLALGELQETLSAQLFVEQIKDNLQLSLEQCILFYLFFLCVFN